MNWAVVDGHVDIAMALAEHPGRAFGLPAPAGQAVSLPDAQRGNLRLIFGTVFATEGYWAGQTPVEAGEAQMQCYDALLAEHAGELFRVARRGDLEQARRGERIGLVHLMEGADPITSPADLARWVDRGVRVVALAWNTANQYACGIRETRGLTPEGFALLAEMRRLSVIPDLSHLARRSVDQVLDAGPGVVVASHSNADALHPHLRNLTDAHIDAIAARDGVVGVVLFNPFLGPLSGTDAVTIDTVVAHIDHMVSRVGARHVGIGSDLDGGFSTDNAPEGIDSLADLQRIGDALSRKGYADNDVAGILGDNWLRVLEDALPD